MTSVRVVAAIIARDGSVLAARRADVEHGGWEFPGGKIEEGEGAEQALERELAEELGCKVASAWPYDTISLEEDERHLTMECFVCALASGAEPALDESVHAELRWLGREELADVEWLPADALVARSLACYWDEALVDQQL